MTLAKDIMESRVVTVSADHTVVDVCRLFYEEEISGAPVVDENDRVIGVVSLTDLVRTAQEEEREAVASPGYYKDLEADTRPEWLTEAEEFEDRMIRRRIIDVMTAEIVSVTPETPIPEVVAKILDYRVHRVLVLEDQEGGGNLAGMITLFDLVQLLE